MVKLKRYYLFFLLHLAGNFASAQAEKKNTLLFQVVFSDSLLKSGDAFYKLHLRDSVQIETLKFYISGIELLNNNKSCWKEQNGFHLLDIEKDFTMKIELNVPPEIRYNQLKFYLGIDSTTNVSGAMGGDLDPTNGMYWTWQSGYINFKIEGKSNLSSARKHEFQFHLGGYQFPFNALRTVSLDVKQSEELRIVFDAKEFLESIDFSKQDHVMSPSSDAVILSTKVANAFRIKQ